MAETPEIKSVTIQCNLCGVKWKKHWKKVVTEQMTGKSIVKLEKWIPSKEVHVCKSKQEIERKDWK